MKKKIITLIFAVMVTTLCFAGCSGKEEVTSVQTEATTQAETTAETVTTQAATTETPATEVTTETVTSEETTTETTTVETTTAEVTTEVSGTVTIDGTYTSKNDVAAYIHEYSCLPSNFITKKEAHKLGWQGGYLEPYAPGKTIGGDRFGNREKQLPDESGRKYYECDIGYEGGTRNGKRIIYSDDGLIYYTDDHYSSFTLLYGEP